MSDHVTCADFDEAADELALGTITEPRRGELLAHAASCSACRTLLDGLVSVADHLLLLAPQAEPPAAFESRVLARIGTPAPARRSVPWWLAAAACVLTLIGGALAARSWGDHAGGSAAGRVERADVVAVDGSTVGDIELHESPSPYVLVHVDSPRPGPGVRTCSLQRADGTWVAVGTWSYQEIATGTWAVGIDPTLLDAVSMRITDSDGTLLATATFD